MKVALWPSNHDRVRVLNIVYERIWVGDYVRLRGGAFVRLRK